jgi:hypothetical protein
MRPLSYKHYFTVIDEKFVWDDLEMFRLIKKTLDGKRGYAIIEEEVDKASSNQFAYYFGGIIRRECMSSNVFAGMSEKEIHNHLLFEVLGSVRNIAMGDGTTKVMNCIPDFDQIKDSKKQMTEYLEKLIPHLATEYNINVKPASMYKYNKYYIKTETIK